MKIVAGSIELPISETLERGEFINGKRTDIFEVFMDRCPTQDEVDALSNNESWSIIDDLGRIETKKNFIIPVKFSIWMGKREVDELLLAEKEATINTLMAERAALVEERSKLVAALPTLLEGKSEEIALQFKEYLPDVKAEQPIVGKS